MHHLKISRYATVYVMVFIFLVSIRVNLQMIIFVLSGVNSLKYYFHRQPASQTVQAGTKRVLIQCYIKNYKVRFV